MTNPTTSPDPLVEELRDIASTARWAIARGNKYGTWSNERLAKVDDAAARIEADSRLLRLADALAGAVADLQVQEDDDHGHGGDGEGCRYCELGDDLYNYTTARAAQHDGARR